MLVLGDGEAGLEMDCRSGRDANNYYDDDWLTRRIQITSGTLFGIIVQWKRLLQLIKNRTLGSLKLNGEVRTEPREKATAVTNREDMEKRDRAPFWKVGLSEMSFFRIHIFFARLLLSVIYFPFVVCYGKVGVTNLTHRWVITWQAAYRDVGYIRLCGFGDTRWFIFFIL